MICGNNLSTVALISNFDTTRSTMAAKQILQAVASENCDIPYLLSPDHLKFSSDLSLFRAKYDGIVKYIDEDIMVIHYNLGDSDSDNIEVKILSIPKYKKTSDKFCIELKMVLPIGTKFKKTDILFEYTGFSNGVITLGYNLNTAFMGYFGLTFSDSIVISKSVSKLLRATKLVSKLIYIYADSNFDFEKYPDSKYKFIPDVGSVVDDINLYTMLSSDGEVISNDTLPSVGGIVKKLRFHKILNTKVKRKTRKDLISYLRMLNNPIRAITKTLNIIINKNLRDIVSLMFHEASVELLTSFNKMADTMGDSLLAYELLWLYKTNIKPITIPGSQKSGQLLFVVEIDVVFDIPAKVGDKMTNTYANKGIISKIVDDDLMPYNKITGRRVDVIVGALSVYSRMIFSQIINISISKCVQRVEETVIADNSKLVSELRKLQKIINYTNSEDPEYINKVENLIQRFENGEEGLKQTFIADITNQNLYIHYPAFGTIDYGELLKLIHDTFGILAFDDISIPVGAFKKYDGGIIDPPIGDVVVKNVFNGPNHIMFLKQLSEGKMVSRSNGRYTSNDQPVKGKTDIIGNDHTNDDASKIGTMEFDALIAHGASDVIYETKLIKSNGTASNQLSKFKVDTISALDSDKEFVENLTKNTPVRLKITSLLAFLDDGASLKKDNFI